MGEGGEKQQSVLVVDDDPEVRRIVELFLIRGGYAATSCEDGPAAMEVLKTGASFHALVLDWDRCVRSNIRQQAPDGTESVSTDPDGVVLVRKLRESTARRALAVLIVTGYDSAEALDRFKKQIEAAGGVVDSLQKPFFNSKEVTGPLGQLIERAAEIEVKS